MLQWGKIVQLLKRGSMIDINNELEIVLPKAMIIGVNINGDPEFESSMEELESLVEACDMEMVGRMEQNLDHPNAATYIGSGKVGEVQEMVEALELDCVVFEDTLSPSQLKNLQKEITVPVMDRTNLILEIFSKRANTREARLQVETANLQYMLPRLVGLRSALGRQGGASGSMSNKGTGEKQIELDRRRIEHRISELKRELEAIAHDRDIQRRKRMDSALPKVALVGYTNAGKSTLLNKLLKTYGGAEDKMVMAKDMLFATLDTTVRKIEPGDKKDFLLSDTVGFINKLPHGLIKAFRSTLEEAIFADLLLQVIDVSDIHYREHMKVTQDTLRELGAEKVPCLYVLNKADAVYEKEELPRIEGDRIFLSAKEGIGLAELLWKINEIIYGGNQKVKFLFPYDKGEYVNFLNENATVLSQEYLPEGVEMEADCSESVYGKVRDYVVENQEK